MRQSVHWFLVVAWCASAHASPVIKTDPSANDIASTTNITVALFPPADPPASPSAGSEYDSSQNGVTDRAHILDVERPPVFHHTPDAFTTTALPMPEPPRRDPTIVVVETNTDFKDLIAEELNRSEPTVTEDEKKEKTPIAGIFNVILGVGILVILLLRIRS